MNERFVRVGAAIKRSRDSWNKRGHAEAKAIRNEYTHKKSKRRKRRVFEFAFRCFRCWSSSRLEGASTSTHVVDVVLGGMKGAPIIIIKKGGKKKRG